MVRKQIVVTESMDERIRRLAAQRGMSQSALISEAVSRLPDAADQLEGMRRFAGIIRDDGPPDLSAHVDDIYTD